MEFRRTLNEGIKLEYCAMRNGKLQCLNRSYLISFLFEIYSWKWIKGLRTEWLNSCFEVGVAEEAVIDKLLTSAQKCKMSWFERNLNIHQHIVYIMWVRKEKEKHGVILMLVIYIISECFLVPVTSMAPTFMLSANKIFFFCHVFTDYFFLVATRNYPCLFTIFIFLISVRDLSNDFISYRTLLISWAYLKCFMQRTRAEIATWNIIIYRPH